MSAALAAIHHRLRLWWVRGGRTHTIAGVGAVLLLVAIIVTLTSLIRDARMKQPNLEPSHHNLVDLTLVQNATERGAVCLDGSRPGYHLQRGYGSGADKWVLHVEGGGWCNSIESCSLRARTPLGSSRYMGWQYTFVGILSNAPSENPDFYNWNRVKIRYCDGASFSGDKEIQDQNGRKLFFRGQRIWYAIMDELLLKGLANAKQAFLTGCSAGGLATFIHCDSFRSLLPKETEVKCLADAGFFLDEQDISGKRTMKSFYGEVVHLQGVLDSLPKGCTQGAGPRQCFFPHELIKQIKTPFFILNPAYDFWQIQHILIPEESDPRGHWRRCKLNIHDCDSHQMEALQVYRKSMLNALNEFQHRKDVGVFMNSCFAHCQTMSNITWHSPTSPRIKNKTIAEAVGDWYFGRREVKDIDCPYPCNPTCYNIVFN